MEICMNNLQTEIKMEICINDLPREILAFEIFGKLSLANRLNQQRTCRLWEFLMPLKDKELKLIPLVEEMLELWHLEVEEDFEENPKRKKRRKIGASHSFEDCKNQLSLNGPRIIENCLKILLDPELHFFSKTVRKLEIFDQSQVWILNKNSLDFISLYLQNLQFLNISGCEIIPVEEISHFLFELNPGNLKNLILKGPSENSPMFSQNLKKHSQKISNSVLEFLLQCPNLETLDLNLCRFQTVPESVSGIITFPENFQEISIGEESFPEKFRFFSFEKCLKNLKKISLRISNLDLNDWNSLINSQFPDLEEFSRVSVFPVLEEFSCFSAFPNSEILANFCAKFTNLKTLKIRLEIRDLKPENLLPIRCLTELTELCLDLTKYNTWKLLLDSNSVQNFLSPNLEKFTFGINDVKELILLEISKICGRKLKFFHLNTSKRCRFQGNFLGEFLDECPNLSELRIVNPLNLKIDKISKKPPENLKFLSIDLRSKERSKIFQFIRTLCLERKKFNQTKEILTLDTWTNHSENFYLNLREFLNEANVLLVIDYFRPKTSRDFW